MGLCACMGPRPGNPTMCYCQLKAAGLPTTEYEWSAEDVARLHQALADAYGKNAVTKVAVHEVRQQPSD